MANNQQETDGLITIPLKDLLLMLVGTEESGIDKRCIPESTALILNLQFKDSLIFKIVEEDGHWWLWRYKDWITSQQRLERQRAYAESERIRRWIFSDNVGIVARAIMRKSKVPEPVAQAMAYSLMTNPNARVVITEFFGVEKLKEKESDL